MSPCSARGARAVLAEGPVPPIPPVTRRQRGPAAGGHGRARGLSLPARAGASSGTPRPGPALCDRRGPPGRSGSAAPPLPFSCSRCRGRPGATSCPARCSPARRLPHRAAPRGTTGLAVRSALPAPPRPRRRTTSPRAHRGRPSAHVRAHDRKRRGRASRRVCVT